MINLKSFMIYFVMSIALTACGHEETKEQHTQLTPDNNIKNLTNNPPNKIEINLINLEDFIKYDITEIMPYGGEQEQDKFFSYIVKTEYRNPSSSCQSANLTNSYHQTSLGFVLQDKKHFREAMQCYLLAAEKGNAYATNRIGEMYLLGLGVKKDIKQAQVWFKKSADRGYYFAEFLQGITYIDFPVTSKTVDIHPLGGISSNPNKFKYINIGKNANLKEAQYWLSRAARQGQINSRILLSRMGFLLDKNKIENPINTEIKINNRSVKINSDYLPDRYSISYPNDYILYINKDNVLNFGEKSDFY